MSIKENDYVKGVDMNNNPIEGTVSNILKVLQVAIIKTGDDRLDVAQAYMSDLEKITK